MLSSYVALWLYHVQSSEDGAACHIQTPSLYDWKIVKSDLKP